MEGSFTTSLEDGYKKRLEVGGLRLEARKGKEEKTWLEVGGLRLEAKKNKGGKLV